MWLRHLRHHVMGIQDGIASCPFPVEGQEGPLGFCERSQEFFISLNPACMLHIQQGSCSHCHLHLRSGTYPEEVEFSVKIYTYLWGQSTCQKNRWFRRIMLINGGKHILDWTSLWVWQEETVVVVKIVMQQDLE